MAKRKRARPPASEVPKKSYRRPELIEHGDLRALTQEKGEVKQDGGGKPSTRLSGLPA